MRRVFKIRPVQANWTFDWLRAPLNHDHFESPSELSEDELQSAFGTFTPVKSLNPYMTKLSLCSISEDEIIERGTNSVFLYRKQLFRLHPSYSGIGISWTGQWTVWLEFWIVVESQIKTMFKSQLKLSQNWNYFWLLVLCAMLNTLVCISISLPGTNTETRPWGPWMKVHEIWFDFLWGRVQKLSRA